MNMEKNEEYMRYIDHQKKKHPKKMIKSQTGSGKTENIGKLMKNLMFGSCIVAVPTNPLKKEVYNRLVGMGINNIKMTPELEELKDEEIDEEQKRYMEIGAWNKRKKYLQEQVKRLQEKEQSKEGLTENEKKDLNNIRRYLIENEKINHYGGHIVTTHERAINLHYYLIMTHSLIIDEDILIKTCIQTPTLKLNYIENTFDVASEVVKNKFKKKWEEIQNAPLGQIVPVSVYNKKWITKEKREELEETLAETNKCIYNIYDLLECSAIYKYKDPKQNEIKAQCLICRKPPNMKTTILSATVDEDIYKNFFKDDNIEFVELSKAKYKGEIIQDSTITYSRKSLAKGKDKEETEENYKNGISPILDQIREKHKGLPLITFKKYCKEGEYHFGAIEGLDILKGKDIVVVGLPYHNELQYRFFMYAVYGTVYNPVEKSRFRRIEYNNYSFKLNTQQNERYQRIQTYLISTELEQAVGRARLLRYNCKVYLYSGFPVEQTSIVYNSLEIPVMNEEEQQEIEHFEENT